MITPIALVLALAGVSLDVGSIDPPTTLDGEWRCVSGDNSAFADAAFDDSTWTPVVLPETGAAACKGAVTWLRKRFLVPEAFRTAALGISPGLVEGDFKVYVDGVVVGGHGDVVR